MRIASSPVSALRFQIPVGSCPGAPFALAPPLVRVIFEKEGEQAPWPWGWVQHHEATDSAREPKVQLELLLRASKGRHLPGLRASDYLRRPCRPGDLLSPLSGRCCRGPSAPWGSLPEGRIDPPLRFAASPPAAPLTLAARRCSQRAEGERPAGSGIPSCLPPRAASSRRRAPRSCNFQSRE